VASGGAGASPGALVDLNNATTAQLEELPGVGPVLAQRIVDWRTEHGRFTSVDELGEVSGIGEKIFAQLRPKVTV
jgi:competence protein ComEA